MRAFVFTEMQYPFVDEEAHESVRVTLPNKVYDPQVGHELYKRYFDLYERARVTRTARVVLATREMGRIYHAKGVERPVRNDLFRGRTAQRYYDSLEWLYGWKVDRCLEVTR